MVPKTPSEALSISLHRLSGAPADVVPPRVVAESWFAPPTSFAYKFLASEFEVDDEVDVDAEDAALLSPDGLLDRTGNGTDELNFGVLFVREQDVSGFHLGSGFGGHARDEPVEVGGMQGEPVGCGNGMGLAMGAALEADVQTFPDLDGCRHVQVYVRDLRRKGRL